MNRLTRYRLDRLRHRIRSQYGLFTAPEEADAYVAHYGREVEAFFRRQNDRRQKLTELLGDVRMGVAVIVLVWAFYLFVFPGFVYRGADALRWLSQWGS